MDVVRPIPNVATQKVAEQFGRNRLLSNGMTSCQLQLKATKPKAINNSLHLLHQPRTSLTKIIQAVMR